jgi:hypothetical protein
MAAKKNIEKRVRFLVEILNQLPGVKTISSCGGHKNARPGQSPQGTFFVDFNISPPPFELSDDGDADENDPGAESVSLIKNAIRSFEGKVILNNPILKKYYIRLSGQNVEPDDVALAIFQRKHWRESMERELAEIHSESIELEKKVDDLVRRRGW